MKIFHLACVVDNLDQVCSVNQDEETPESGDQQQEMHGVSGNYFCVFRFFFDIFLFS